MRGQGLFPNVRFNGFLFAYRLIAAASGRLFHWRKPKMTNLNFDQLRSRSEFARLLGVSVDTEDRRLSRQRYPEIFECPHDRRGVTMSYFEKQRSSRPGTVQSVAYTGAAGTISNVVGAQTYQVRVWCTSQAYIAFGDSPTAQLASPGQKLRFHHQRAVGHCRSA